MKQGEELVEIKILVSKKSYKEYFKARGARGLEIDPGYLFNLLCKDFDVKKIEVHNACVCKSTPSLYVQVSSNGSISELKGWGKEETGK